MQPYDTVKRTLLKNATSESTGSLETSLSSTELNNMLGLPNGH